MGPKVLQHALRPRIGVRVRGRGRIWALVKKDIHFGLQSPELGPLGPLVMEPLAVTCPQMPTRAASQL